MTDSVLARELEGRKLVANCSRNLAACVLMLFALLMAGSAQTARVEGRAKVVNSRISPPRLVKVGKETYLITVVKRFADPHLLGETSNEKRRISILAGQSLVDEQDAVWHELKHAALKTSHSDDMETLHDFIYQSSPLEIAILKDNPQLVKYLTQ